MDQKTRDDLLDLFQSKLNEAMRFYLETCTRCGVCTEACHVYASLGQVRYIAAYRAEIVRRLYKKYFKGRGKLWPSVGEAKELTEMAVEELFDAAYSCTGCRRCMVYCPFGIDTQQLMSIAKLLLIGANEEPEILTLLADTSIEKGRSLELFKEGFLEGIKRLEADVVDKWQTQAGTTPIPVDVEGADLLYVALAGAHSIIPAAAVFNAAGENWTLSFFEAVNFGAFVGDPTKTKLILDRIISEANRLKIKEVSCFDLSDSGKSDFDMLMMNIHDNLHTRNLNYVEKSMIINRLRDTLKAEELDNDIISIIGMNKPI